MSDKGKQFDNSKFRDFCVELGIKNYYLSPAHPQSNGQAEVTIGTLKAALKTKLEDLKGKWVEYLPEVLRAYKTTQKSATRETQFALAFGTEAVAPVEVGLKSPRIELAAVKEQNIGNYGYIGTWILRKYWKYRKISVDILTKISIMQKLIKIF